MKKDKTVKKVTKKKKVVKKKEPFFKQVKLELSKVKWPTLKDVLKYTIATIVFVAILVAFFMALGLLMSLVKGAFN